MVIKRYNSYLARLDPTVGSEIRKTNPVVIVSDDMMNKHLDTIVTCPLTTKLHPMWRSRIQTVCAGHTAEVSVQRDTKTLRVFPLRDSSSGVKNP